MNEYDRRILEGLHREAARLSAYEVASRDRTDRGNTSDSVTDFWIVEALISLMHKADK